MGVSRSRSTTTASSSAHRRCLRQTVHPDKEFRYVRQTTAWAAATKPSARRDGPVDVAHLWNINSMVRDVDGATPGPDDDRGRRHGRVHDCAGQPADGRRDDSPLEFGPHRGHGEPGVGDVHAHGLERISDGHRDRHGRRGSRWPRGLRSADDRRHECRPALRRRRSGRRGGQQPRQRRRAHRGLAHGRPDDDRSRRHRDVRRRADIPALGRRDD